MPMPERPVFDQARYEQDRELELSFPDRYLHSMPRNVGQRIFLPKQNEITTALSETIPGFFEATEGAADLLYAESEHVFGTMFGHSQDAYVHAVKKNVDQKDANLSLAVMSGVCLWGAGEVLGLTDQEEAADLRRELLTRRIQLVEIATLEGQHPYGVEATARLTRTIANLRKYAEQFGRGSDIPVRVHLPNAEYKFPMIAVYQKGRVSKAFLQKYLDVVDAKYVEMRDRVNTEFNYYDMPVPQYVSPLTEQVGGADLTELSQKLELGTTYFDTAESHASYIVGMLDFSAAHADKLPIIVDTISERSYFKEASESDAFRGVGIYPLPLFLKENGELPIRRRSAMLYSEVYRTVLPWRYGSAV